MWKSILKIVLFSALLLLCQISMLGQKDLAQEKVTLKFNDAGFDEIFREIERQSGLSFSYSSRLIDSRKTISINLISVPLDDALDVIFNDEKIRYIFIEEQIVLKRARKKDAVLLPSNAVPEDTLIVDPFTISGYVRDALSGEILIGATIAVPGGNNGGITNKYGFYSLTVREPLSELICTYVGYGKLSLPVDRLRSQSLDFSMEKEISQLQEVIVYSNDQEQLIKTARSSEASIKPEAVRKMPALLGEKDVIKSLAAVPGIKFFGDGSTIFYVRGGMRDQNMITLDEATIYNPSHMLGFFSTVIPDAVKDIQIYKGDFPANYGGRLSSLIDIRTKDGNMNRFGMDGSVGLISSRLSIEGPIWKDHISYFVSGRHSYITKIAQSSNPSLNDLHFADLHAKINYRINDKNRIFFSIYNGTDNYEVQENRSRKSGINWQNATSTLRWNHLFSDKLFSNTTISGSRYDYYLNRNIDNGDYWNSHVDNFSIKTDFTWYQKPDNTIRYGLLFTEHFFNPGNYYRSNQQVDLGYEISRKRAREYALYVSDQMTIADRLSLRMGIRITAWQNVGEAVEYDIVEAEGGDFPRDSIAVRSYAAGEVYNTYWAIDPRLSAVYKLTENDLLKFSYSRTSQFQYLITNSISPFTSLEVWLPSSPNVKPQYSGQFTLGYSHAFKPHGIELEADLYYKTMTNLIDYRDHAHMLMNPFVEYELRFGSGVAYGLELSASKTSGKLSGWISYTLSKALYSVDGINNGNPYPAYSDRPHDISTVISWHFKPKLTLTATFIYMTGSPFTTPTAFYYFDSHQVPVYAERNNDRLPDYHRLDAALNWQLNKPGNRFKHELIFSVYNLYNRWNPVAIHFNKIQDDNGNYVVPSDYYTNPELMKTQFYLYGTVPSISYHFSF